MSSSCRHEYKEWVLLVICVLGYEWLVVVGLRRHLKYYTLYMYIISISWSYLVTRFLGFDWPNRYLRSDF